MRTLARFATFTALVAAALGLTSRDARAGAAAGGAICEYVSGDPIQYGTNAVEMDGVSVVACALPVDHALGTTVHFRVVFTDNLDNDVVTCNGYAYNQDGTQLAASANITSSECSVTPPVPGCKAHAEATITVSPQSTTNVYVLRCATPVAGNTYSAIESVRVY